MKSQIFILLTFLSLDVKAGMYTYLTWRDPDVKVCFATPAELNPNMKKYKVVDWKDEKKEVVQRVVEREFSPQRTGINFYGFEDCETSGEDSQIAIFMQKKSTIKTALLGGNIASSTVGFILFYPTSKYPSIRGMILLSNLAKETSIVHEFGHSAGLFHEHEHPNAHNTEVFCRNTKSGETKRHGRIYRPFDHESVMNYCYIHSNKGARAGLSQGDIDTLLEIYKEERVKKDDKLNSHQM